MDRQNVLDFVGSYFQELWQPFFESTAASPRSRCRGVHKSNPVAGADSDGDQAQYNSGFLTESPLSFTEVAE